MAAAGKPQAEAVQAGKNNNNAGRISAGCAQHGMVNCKKEEVWEGDDVRNECSERVMACQMDTDGAGDAPWVDRGRWKGNSAWTQPHHASKLIRLKINFVGFQAPGALC